MEHESGIWGIRDNKIFGSGMSMTLGLKLASICVYFKYFFRENIPFRYKYRGKPSIRGKNNVVWPLDVCN
jgi:hypothetical protein